MKNITSYYLNTLISEVIEESIELYRQSKNTVYFDGLPYVTGQEIRDFTFSSPYFSEELKEFLYTWDNSVFIGVTKNWMNRFFECIDLWSQSDVWLHYDVKYICNPSLNTHPSIKKLNLPSHNKEIL